jgi:hypothetical protein
VATYSWLTKTAAISALQARLYGSQYWSSTELWLYLSESLRILNAYTEQWNGDFALGLANGAWVNTGTVAGSPRVRTRTCNDLFTQMEYMLLEPATGGTWTGSSQFSITDLQIALQRRLQEIIQATACNLGQLSPIYALPNTRRYALGDTVLEARRARGLWVLANTTGTAASGALAITLASAAGVSAGQVLTGAGIQAGTFVTAVSGTVISLSLPTTGALSATPLQFSQPLTMTREDSQAFQYFEPDYLQTNAIPQSWGVVSEPPLSFAVDTAPNTAGQYDVLALLSGPVISPPTAALLGVPDDWSWVPMYGALADLLNREPESSDRQRAAYCLQRYAQGLEAMVNSNWLLKATVNGIAVDTPSVYEMDTWAPEWQASNGNLPAVVQAGIDFVAPTPGVGQAISMTLVQNAPLLDVTNTYVQVSRDDFEAVLNYAQHISVFKQPGQGFAATMPLLQDFMRSASATNKRLLTYGLYSEALKTQGQRQEMEVTR